MTEFIGTDRMEDEAPGTFLYRASLPLLLLQKGIHIMLLEKNSLSKTDIIML